MSDNAAALTNKDKSFLASVLALTTDLRQLSNEWKSCITKGVTVLKSAKISVTRTLKELTDIVDQLQDVVTRMGRARQKLVNMVQTATPPGVMGLSALLKAQEEARIAAEEAAVKNQLEREMYGSDDSDIDVDSETESTEMADTTQPTYKQVGYRPSPSLLTRAVPGTQATPFDLIRYADYFFGQAQDEITLKEGILDALAKIVEVKDSGEDELPPILDQQLTNLSLLWELEPYLDTLPERTQREEALGILSWQAEMMK